MDWMLLGMLALAWLISPVFLLVALIVARRRLRELRERGVTADGAPSAPPPRYETPPTLPAPVLGGERRYTFGELENLSLLQLELRRLARAGELAEERHRQLSDEAHRLWERHLRGGGLSPGDDVWRLRRAMGWNLLVQASESPPGPPPWQSPPSEPVAVSGPVAPPGPARLATPPAVPPAAVGAFDPPALTLEPLQPPAEEPLELAPGPNPDFGRPASTPSLSMRPDQSFERSASGPAWEEDVSARDDWRPATPNPLERALRALSGWPRLIAPFLAQNIGWFIGGFCFIAGALFLIANTRGFVNALMVFASLFGATVFLIWSGYQFRRKRPEMGVASAVLLTLGSLLTPLVLAVAVGLIGASAGHGGALAVSGLIVAGALVAFAWAASLVSGLMDRTLMGRYPWLLTGLAAVQLAAPLAAVAPHWSVLAAWHGALLGLLGYGLWTFAGAWLRRLFVDRRLTTYYAAGLLVYTAAVSFLHLTWVWPAALPAGYAGPFLMALCGLLFPLDAAFKEWVDKAAFLSRFSFALYGLSAVAVAVALPNPAMAMVTLALGAVLYGWVTWRYRTLPPLYLLFGCVAGLYGYVLAHTLPPAWHGLAGLPGLLALLRLGHWASSRSRAIALQCLAALGVSLVGLTAWSLPWGAPGWVGFLTAASAALLAYYAVRLALDLPQADPRWAWADGAVVALAMIAAAVAPAEPSLGWGPRVAFGWLALAGLWTALGLHDRRQSAISRSVFVAGALLDIGLALGLTAATSWPALLTRWEPIASLTLAGALLLWLTLGLRRQALFYGVLACAGGVGVLVKQGYFPGPSTGLVEFLVVLGLWLALWRLARSARLRAALVGDPAEDRSAATRLEPLVRAPLERAMGLLWVVGLIHLGQRWTAGGMTGSWPWIAALAMLTGLLLIGHFRWFRWTAVPVLLGLIGVTVALERAGWTLPWLNAMAVAYALLVWRLSVMALDRPLTHRLAQALLFATPGGAGGRWQVEDSVRDGAVLIATAAVAASPALAWSGWSMGQLWPALALGLLLFVLTGWRYRAASYAYAALATLIVGVWLAGERATSAVLFGLDQPLSNALLSLAMTGVAVRLERERIAGTDYWRGPLAMTGSALYGLALAGAVLGFLAGDPRLPGLLGLLCVALFPAARGWPNAAAWRGLALPLLLSALAGSIADRVGFDGKTGIWLALGWGYALWGVGNLLLPRWNARQPLWAVEPLAWPILGLVSVVASGALGLSAGALSPAAVALGAAFYLLLLLRNTAWPGMAWLAVASLTASGVLASGASEWSGWGDPVEPSALRSGMAIVLVWLNLLWLLIPWWRRQGRRWAHWLNWRQSELAAPLFWIPFAVLALLLIRVLWWEAASLPWDGASPAARESWALSGSALLLAATAGHAFWLRADGLTAQALLVGLGLTVLAALLDGAAPLAWLPLALALWNGALLLAWRFGPARWAVWRSALQPWLDLLPVFSLGLLPYVAATHWAMTTLTLAALAAVTLARGWWREQAAWLQAGLALALAALHVAWLSGEVGFDGRWITGLAPWYALQDVLLLLGFMGARGRLAAWLETVGSADESNRFQCKLAWTAASASLSRWLLALGALWLAWHGCALTAHLTGWGPWPWRFGPPADALAAGAALLSLAGLSVVRAWRRPAESKWIYATALALGLLAGYGRLLTLGLTPVTVGDTAALIAAAYAAFLLHQFTGLPALYRLALGLPLLALATAPWQIASVWAGGTLLAAAVLYLSLATTLRNPWPLYLGVLALNGAVYLWAPLWAERYGLWQFYIVPAAISVLALLQLHRRELRPKVLNGARLAALSALYAGAGLDVFLRPELGIFVLALALALLGVIAGIALRIRAFLYAGVAFLVLNVIGQLVRFYPDQGLSRALILLGLGATITVGMVWFNLKREAILQRVRIMRADLAAWE